MNSAGRPLVEIEDLCVTFRLPRRSLLASPPLLKAVDGVSLDIPEGVTVGLVGESGSGKSTLGRAVVGVRRPSSGNVRFDGVALFEARKVELRRLRRHFQMVSQDPYSALNPRMKVGQIIAEPLVIHALGTRLEQRQRVESVLDMVGLESGMAARYPHQFSGGQRQRIAIARALAAEPKFLVLDEPISSLDVSMQAQVMNLLMDLRRQLNLTFLFIAHDLAVVRLVADVVAVMHLGKLVERGPARAILEAPAHPYTRALMSAVLPADPAMARGRKRVVLRGDVPSPVDPPAGCRFHTRCWLYEGLGRPERCRSEEPPLTTVDGTRASACHFAHQALESDVGAIPPYVPAWKRRVPAIGQRAGGEA